MSTEDQQDLQNLKRSRPRPVLSCLECRRKKLKCDRLLPCQQCLKLNQPSACQYAPGQEPEVRESGHAPGRAAKRVHRDISVDSSQTSIVNSADDLRERVRNLEETLRLQRTMRSSPSLHTGQSASNDAYNAVSFLAPVDDEFSVFEKFSDARQSIQSMRERRDDPEVQRISKQLGVIHHTITKPSFTHPIVFTSYEDIGELIQHIIQFLPALPVRKKLVEHYFENFEHCSRVLHIPNFLLHNRQFNQRTLDQSQSEYFVPALLGVLCIASSLNTYPECELSGLHGTQNSLSVLQLLNNWYELVTRRDGLTIPAIQVKVLVIRIQRYQNMDAHSLWASSAQLLRQAMMTGLHKEPSKSMNNHDAEIRRCIWLAILEHDLALSIACEMPPLCPPYNLRYPANCDDNELSDTSTTNPPEYPTHHWTDGLCAHILGKTFNRRLEAYKHRFAARSASHYAETLEHARSLETILRELPSLFRLDHASNTPSRLMAQMELDISLRRPLIATYAPYARAVPINNMYREVRVPWVQSHYVVMCFQDLFDPQYPGIDVPRPIGYWDFFWTAYSHDTIPSVEAMLVEGHHLKYEKSMQTAGTDNGHHGADGDFPAGVRRWDFSAVMKSIEDTLGPMSRRIGPSRGDLRNIVRYSMLYDCLRAPPNKDVYPYILEGLRGLTSSLQVKLEREGFNLETITEVQSGASNGGEWLADFLSLKELGRRPSQPS